MPNRDRRAQRDLHERSLRDVDVGPFVQQRGRATDGGPGGGATKCSADEGTRTDFGQSAAVLAFAAYGVGHDRDQLAIDLDRRDGAGDFGLSDAPAARGLRDRSEDLSPGGEHG